MPKYNYKRSDRLGELIHREVGRVLQTEIEDPQLEFVTVTDVDLSDDLRHATVYFTVLDEDKQETRKRLKHAGRFIRTRVAARCYLKYVPELHFRYDETREKAARIDRILDDIRSERNEPEQDTQE